MLLVKKLLPADKVHEVRNLLSNVQALDGRKTAGSAGQGVKNNLQYDPRSPDYEKADLIVRQAMFKNEEYQLYAFPHKMTPVRFSKYTKGMMYGEHFDAAIMPQPNTVLRADLSFTLFLSDPSTYDGGELVVKIMDMEHAVKPDAGDMFVYPSGNRHRVNVITGGCREAGVGWVQSIHASPDRRRVLQNIRSVYNQLLTEDGKSEQFDLLNEAAVTLERMWANP